MLAHARCVYTQLSAVLNVVPVSSWVSVSGRVRLMSSEYALAHFIYLVI